MKKCSTPYCRNEAKYGSVCGKCKSRRYRANNPMKATYQIKRFNAKRKGKEFSLTFEEFSAFAVKVDYLAKKGRTATSMHIDRIDETKGYTADNIQPLENAQNVRKFLRWQLDQRGVPCNYTVDMTKRVDVTNCPF